MQTPLAGYSKLYRRVPAADARPAGEGFKFAPPPSSIGGMRRFGQGPAALALAVLGGLAGCGIQRDVGVAERCADFMQRAFPSAALEVAKSEASATSLTTMIARVQGVRSNLPAEAAAPRDLAVECRFDENVLTGFRWTAGPTR
jgi:hypothetical protein